AELGAEIAVAQAGADAASQKLKQADYEIAVRTVRAPVAGKIVARNTRVGDMVSPANADLLELLPDAPRIVRAELNESFVAKVSVGMQAEVRSEADPQKTYPARVVRIGDVFGPSKLAETSQETTDARDVECILDLDGAPLRVGERVQVRILAGTGR
ncbi:MAG TPA: HlyD family secretion protein, partial [Rudaea sp.]|nr:HlyD family secretion protein [Rudaea sp.]